MPRPALEAESVSLGRSIRGLLASPLQLTGIPLPEGARLDGRYHGSAARSLAPPPLAYDDPGETSFRLPRVRPLELMRRR